MGYLPLVLIAMAGLGIHYFLAKIISPHISSISIALLSGIVFIPFVLVYAHFTQIPIIPEHKEYIGYAMAIGIPMSIALIALYMAIAKGPLSVVMPIYGLNAMLTAVLGILVLHEAVTIPKVIGLVFAVAAIVLLSR